MPPGWEAQDARSPEHLLQDFEARCVDACAAVAPRPGPAPHWRALVCAGPGRNAILRSVVAAFDPNAPLDDDSLRTGSGSEQSLEERGSPSPSGTRPRVPASTQLKIGLCRRERARSCRGKGRVDGATTVTVAVPPGLAVPSRSSPGSPTTSRRPSTSAPASPPKPRTTPFR